MSGATRLTDGTDVGEGLGEDEGVTGAVMDGLSPTLPASAGDPPSTHLHIPACPERYSGAPSLEISKTL
jgi:hypothetical protein